MEVGANPHKPGRPSHTYHTDMIANLRLILEVEVQSGKQIASKKGSRDRKNNRNPLRTVSAWACQNRLVLGQQATDEKSNEITAIPKLLRLLELKGCIVTIDAMGCQRAIAEQIVVQGGDYVLGLKGNQGAMHEAVEDFFSTARENNFAGIAYDYEGVG